MRDRLVAALVGLTITVIALYGVPRALYLHGFVESDVQRSLDRSAGYAAAVADQALAQGAPLVPGLVHDAAADGETVVHRGADGTLTVLAGDGVESGGHLAASRALEDGGTLTVTVPQDVVDEKFRAAVMPLVLLGAALVPLAAFVGLLLARRLSRPFTELAGAAQELGTGRLDLAVPHYRIPEAEAIGRALEHSAERLDLLIRREREVAAHASHELRTPITAVRLTLEDLALWPQTDPQVAEELHRVVAEVDRLSLAVSGLLEDSRSVRMAGVEDGDLGSVVTSCLERWQPVAETVGLALRRVPSPSELPMHLPLPTVARAVDLMLQHACEVAEEDLTVGWAHRGSHLAVEVGYTTSGVEQQPSEAQLEAGELAASVGGRLASETVRGEASPEPGLVRLVLMLPIRQPEQLSA